MHSPMNVKLVSIFVLTKYSQTFFHQICAASVLRGKRTSWGQNRKWEGNYLAHPQENPNVAAYQASISSLRNVDKFQTVMLNGCSCGKYCKRKYS